ncbi:LLM class flavin-dependent oxidoreductase [Gordonia sp. (in: high G+C Gram-positive bacteria)]|uniref:LLM class flavin-dependent oxidoreductase n=1 Tax=Gordonia sp. (in: high G+C Gram-positive bacteria) TaxID=84139 RepID=UPI0016A3409C|nr:LLM class flavin-dependent oxidoreductase [Gordonia sp. (in: high G+C Gram-positive bacteria)]NLG48086.1 LLM class flavin-dependent oxidoreductase [Gordonia sp. (in: high G+C Gram-positive bacteria)]
MSDYGLDLQFGVFLTPSAAVPQQAVDLALTAEDAGIDLVTIQDHPYQPKFLDAWTLMTYIAARTERVILSGNVLNLPLRPPAVLARAAASIDLLSGGRCELALGAGGFVDAIAAMGGPRRTAGESRRALEEAIDVMRALWDTDERGGVRLPGEFYPIDGAKRGPAPAHPIRITIGAYKPRMLDLVGRKCDGVLPSLSYLTNGAADLAEMNAVIDASAVAAGRDPSTIRRYLNLGGTFQGTRDGLLTGPPGSWAADLAGLTRDYGVTGFIFATDDADEIETIGTQVAPATRELVAADRNR